jgi:hypothetical protein
MSTYKVIQDIEAEDKLVGPLSLRQFIYAGIAAICLYLSFLSVTKHAAFMLVIFLPIAAFTGFFAFPWGRDQPTEVWALAKIRLLLKPRMRIWDQSGIKEIVTITVPKKIERALTDGLNQGEVNSRLRALANTIDSRGWAIKNVNVNLYGQPTMAPAASDRLVEASAFPQEVSNLDIRASDDILDEAANPVAQHFNDMINASAQTKRQQLLAQMQQAGSPIAAAPGSQPAPNNYWFLNQPTPVPGQATFVDAAVVAPGTAAAAPVIPQAATPTAEEEALVDKFKAASQQQAAAYGHMKTLQPIDPTAPAPAAPAAAAPSSVTPADQAAIINLAQNDDLDVATIARQARKQQADDDGEVVISLH